MSPEGFHRFQFAFTIAYHYLFPQLTMGLGVILVYFKTREHFWNDRDAALAAEFWTQVFAVNFAFGVVTGIPMEFQLGTNWSRFSETSGGVIGSVLGQEGVFAFFLESAFLGILLYGRKFVGNALHWFSALAVCLGAWISGFFITCTNSWMQHPVGAGVGPQGLELKDLWAVLLNPWELWAYPHVMLGACMTGGIVVAAVGAFYLLNGEHLTQARLYVRTGVGVGLLSGLGLLFPTGHQLAKTVAQDQPATFAGMEALFQTQTQAPLTLFGVPNVQDRKLDHAVEIPGLLSLLAHDSLDAPVTGLDQIPPDNWPTNIPLTFFAYHAMVGIGMALIGILALAAWLLWRRRLWNAKAALFLLVAALPLPYLANTFGWMTAETGRQPWIIYGLMRTNQAYSARVNTGSVVFSLVGFLAMYVFLTALFVILIRGRLRHGPVSHG
jgi:cytochrome d ubiquinol oxidase subunit I